MGLLDKKVAIITGAGGGLGEAYAKLFAREGAAVDGEAHARVSVELRRRHRPPAEVLLEAQLQHHRGAG